MIKQFREQKGYSQEEFARRLNVTQSAVSDWEKGISIPRMKRMESIAKALDINVDLLLRGVSGMGVQNKATYATGNVKSVIPAFAERYTQVPFLSVRGQAGIPDITYEDCKLSWIDETYPVLLPDELKKKKLLVIEIAGDSMEPTILNGAHVLAQHVSANDIRYESGAVYAVMYANRFVVKRIKANTLAISESLILYSDNERIGEIVVEGQDIQCMWKVISKVWEPVR